MSATFVAAVLGIAVTVAIMIVVWKPAKAYVSTPACTVETIPTVFARLKSEGRDGSFAIFMFPSPDRPSADDEINLQFSIEGGRIGLDWCLIGPANIQNREKFERFVGSLGYRIRACEANRVKYLRVEAGDLALLGQKVVRELYGQNPEAKIDMVVEGFSWP